MTDAAQLVRPAPAVDGERRRLVVLSIDAMSDVDVPFARTLPHFARILDGAWGSAQAIYPTVTYPNHTSQTTGRTAAGHGIYANEKVSPGVRLPSWFWDARDIACPTIFDLAKEKGLTSASVGWPVTGWSRSIDIAVPEIWEPRRSRADPRDPARGLLAARPGIRRPPCARDRLGSQAPLRPLQHRRRRRHPPHRRARRALPPPRRRRLRPPRHRPLHRRGQGGVRAGRRLARRAPRRSRGRRHRRRDRHRDRLRPRPRRGGARAACQRAPGPAGLRAPRR